MRVLHLANTAGRSSGGIGDVAHELFLTCHWTFIQPRLECGWCLSRSAQVEKSRGARSYHLAQRGGQGPRAPAKAQPPITLKNIIIAFSAIADQNHDSP